MKLLCLIFIYLCSIFVAGQNRFEITEGNKAVINFKLINNLIFIPVEVNGVELTFFLDTGVAETTVFSLENKEVALKSLEKIKFSGLGSSKSVEGYKTDLNLAKIGKNFVNKNFSFYIISDEDFNISTHIGIPVNGIIGYHFFKNYPLTIDYKAKKITLYADRENFHSKVKKFEELLITLEQYKPYLIADVEMTKEPEKSKLLIDTGNTDAIWLFPTLIKNFVYNRPNIDDYLGRGFNGEIYGKRSRIHNFYLGKFAFSKPLVAMPDEFSIQHLKLVDNRKGSVGGEILRRFTVGFDYEKEKVYFRKNSNYNDPFHFNMSGLDFKQDGVLWEEDLMPLEPKSKYLSTQSTEIINNSAVKYKFVLKPIFSVAGVRQDSPAALAGLKKDDLLIKINNKKTSDLTLEKIIDMMKSQEGQIIEMEIERMNKKMTFRFELEDPIPYSEN